MATPPEELCATLAALMCKPALPPEVLALIAFYAVEDLLDNDKVRDNGYRLYWRGQLPADSAIGCFARCCRAFFGIAMQSLLSAVHLTVAQGSRLPTFTPLSVNRLHKLFDDFGANALRGLSITVTGPSHKADAEALGFISQCTNLRSLRLLSVDLHNADGIPCLLKIFQQLPSFVTAFDLRGLSPEQVIPCLALPNVQQGAQSVKSMTGKLTLMKRAGCPVSTSVLHGPRNIYCRNWPTSII
jgi:hypothetical protein